MKRRKDYGTTSPRNAALRVIPIKVCGVYRITNTLDGKFYIGSATDMRRRLRGHLIELRDGRHVNAHLQRAFARDGESAFSFDVVEQCERQDRLVREQHYFDTLTPHNDEIGYNISPRADSGPSIVFTPEMRAAVSARFKGKPKSDEHRRKIGDAQRIRQCAPEMRDRISRKLKAHFSNPENRKAQSVRQTGLTRRGTPCPVERKQALSVARLGVSRPAFRKYTVEQIDEWIEKRGAGRTFSDIAREAGMSEGVLQRVVRRQLAETGRAPPPEGLRDGWKYSLEETKGWIEKWERGMSIRDISAQSGVDADTLSKTMRRYRRRFAQAA